jgi:hypothetical protein
MSNIEYILTILKNEFLNLEKLMMNVELFVVEIVCFIVFQTSFIIFSIIMFNYLLYKAK